jgi:prolyl-tRNA editing enzyme YbaK/EbsC (Cys-tRNA(Pro) deacylase)
MAEENKWVEPEETDASFNKIREFLNENKVDYTVTEHKAVLTCEEAAEVRGVALASGAKAMLIKDTGKKLTRDGVSYYLAVLSAANRFSSKQFKKTINCKTFRFASPEEVHEVTGCLPGAVPPFGKIFGIPVWVDRSLGKNEVINFNCGMRTKSISMKYEDYFNVEEPTFQVFTEEEVELGDIPEIKTEEKGDDRAAKKAARLAERQKKVATESDAKWDPSDPSAALFGEREVQRSQCDPELRFTKKFTDVINISKDMQGQKVTVRGRLHMATGKGGMTFVVLRQQYATIQCVVSVSAEENISKGMVEYIRKIPKESIIEITADVTCPEKPVEKCSQHDVELKINTFFVVNKSAPILPFQIDDASTLCTNQAAEDAAEGGDDSKGTMVKLDVRLNNRIIDLRVPTNLAIFKLQSGVCKLYRDFMLKNNFVEIHTPKMIGGASEGGSNVFKFKYFG